MSDRRPLRLLAVSPTSVAGGAEKILLDQVRRLSRHDIDVTVVTLAGGWLADRLDEESFDHRRIEAGRMRHVHRAVPVVVELARLARSFDLVYSSQPKAHLYAGVAASLARRAAAWSQVVVPDPPNRMDRAACRVPADLVVVLSKAAADAQSAIAGSPPVALIHPGIDPDLFVGRRDERARAALGAGPDDVLVGIVGRLEAWKRQDEFLRAAAIVANDRPNVRFAVVGGALLGWEGDYPARLRRLADDLGISSRVVFTGHIEDVPSTMASLDVMVNASTPEPFGLVITEALACGVPVVAIDAGGPREVVRPGVDGLLVPTGSAPELALAIGDLVDQPERRRAMGEAGRDHVIRHFGVDAAVTRFAETLRDVVDRRAGR